MECLTSPQMLLSTTTTGSTTGATTATPQLAIGSDSVKTLFYTDTVKGELTTFFDLAHSVSTIHSCLDNPNLVPGLAEERLVDAYESGIIDPTKVVRSAIENAAAAAVTLLMTECVIHEKPSEKKNNEDFGMAGMGM
jgi:hypothetical protein